MEGISLNSGSRKIFQQFLQSNPLVRLGHLVLLENGNLRAVWKGDDASQVGLQFLEDGQIQYVLFKRRHAEQPISRAYGRDTPHGIIRQVNALELGEVMHG